MPHSALRPISVCVSLSGVHAILPAERSSYCGETTIKISILISTYGSEEWSYLAHERAVPSTEGQGAYEVIVHHEPSGTVASTRNGAAARASGDYLCILDGDDQLAPGFIAAMQEVGRPALPAAAPLLFTPRVSYVHNPRRPASEPKFWSECDIRWANWLVVGTLVPRSLFLGVGGFDDRPDFGAFEDWALWVKCAKAGAEIVKVPDAVYIAYWSQSSRHHSSTVRERTGWHYAIGKTYHPGLYTEDWLQKFHARARKR